MLDGGRLRDESEKREYGGIKTASVKDINGLDQDDGSENKNEVDRIQIGFKRCQGDFGLDWIWKDKGRSGQNLWHEQLGRQRWQIQGQEQMRRMRCLNH